MSGFVCVRRNMYNTSLQEGRERGLLYFTL